MYDIIKRLTPRDPDYPERYYHLMLYNKVLNGTLYDCFRYPYQPEYIGPVSAPKYIPEDQRAPCVNTGMNLCRSVVEQSVGFLFGEDRFPAFSMVQDEATRNWINDVVIDTHLVHVMQEVVTKGSIGSAAIWLRVLNNRFFLSVMDTIFLTPTFDPREPDKLIRIVEKKKVLGSDLLDAGYAIDENDRHIWFWFQRAWDSQDEIWWHPWKLGAEKDRDFQMRVDDDRSVHHGLGLVPWVWAKNLVGGDNDVDGRCTFEPAIENCVQIDYAISRADRALKFNSDPLMIVKTRNPNQYQDFVKGDGNALVIGPEGDAKILEVSGDAAHAILETVNELRDQALAAIHGSRADPDKLATSNSNVAQRMLYLPMVQLAAHLRVSWGDMCLVPLLKMMIQIAQQIDIKVLGKVPPTPDPMQPIFLQWSDFFPKTPFDQAQAATTMQLLVTTGIISKRTALANLRDFFDFGTMEEEEAQIKKERDEDMQRETDAQIAVVKAKPTPSGPSS